jgi:crotonobetainyl-CoA:carnitine CoA-transferase CaiB-like acyl-CoA transferase
MPVAALPLAGVSVRKLAQGVSGPLCGKLLAEFGAQVVKVEPPTEEITRHRAPFAHAQPDLEGSLQDLYLNTAKCSITLQLGCRAGMRLFKALLHRQLYAGWLGVRPHEQARLRAQGGV